MLLLDQLLIALMSRILRRPRSNETINDTEQKNKFLIFLLNDGIGEARKRWHWPAIGGIKIWLSI